MLHLTSYCMLHSLSHLILHPTFCMCYIPCHTLCTSRACYILITPVLHSVPYPYHILHVYSPHPMSHPVLHPVLHPMSHPTTSYVTPCFTPYVTSYVTPCVTPGNIFMFRSLIHFYHILSPQTIILTSRLMPDPIPI